MGLPVDKTEVLDADSVPALDRRSGLHKIYRLVALVSIAAAAWLAFENREFLQDEVTLQISGLPILVSAVLSILVLAAGIVLMVPNSLLFIMIGALFGWRWGLLLNLSGFMLGSLLAFLIARYLARDYLDRFAHSSIIRLSEAVSREGWKAVALLRIVPIFPAFLINYLLGVTGVRVRDYLWASVVFIFPGCFIFTYVGAVGRDALTDSSASPERLLMAISLVLGLVIVTTIYKRRSRSRGS